MRTGIHLKTHSQRRGKRATHRMAKLLQYLALPTTKKGERIFCPTRLVTDQVSSVLNLTRLHNGQTRSKIGPNLRPFWQMTTRPSAAHQSHQRMVVVLHILWRKMDETTADLQTGKYKKPDINQDYVYVSWVNLAPPCGDTIPCVRQLIKCSKFSEKFTQSHGTWVRIAMDRLICNTSVRQASCLRDLRLLRDLQLGRLKRITLFLEGFLEVLPDPPHFVTVGHSITTS